MTDPTRISLAVDPQSRRMSGVAYHGNTHFDVPFISEIVSGLWQGGCENGLVLPAFIDHLVSLYPWEQYNRRGDGILDSLLTVKMFDSVEQGFHQVLDIAAWVNSCRKLGPTLVHCQAGLNRSSLVVATALVLDGMAGREAVALLREKRSPACLCNPAFEEFVLNGCIA